MKNKKIIWGLIIALFLGVITYAIVRKYQEEGEISFSYKTPEKKFEFGGK